MSARTPRRTFTRSFVVTLAAVPACAGSGTGGPPPPAYVEPAEPGSSAGPVAPAPAPSAPTSPSEPAQPQPKPSDSAERWVITKSGAMCLAYPQVECPKAPPGQPVPPCNPPPARAYTCPDGMTEPSITVVKYANTSVCEIEPKPVQCPPKAACDHPPPRPVACPK